MDFVHDQLATGNKIRVLHVAQLQVATQAQLGRDIGGDIPRHSAVLNAKMPIGLVYCPSSRSVTTVSKSVSS